jgi:hypothetical protein
MKVELIKCHNKCPKYASGRTPFYCGSHPACGPWFGTVGVDEVVVVVQDSPQIETNDAAVVLKHMKCLVFTAADTQFNAM